MLKVILLLVAGCLVAQAQRQELVFQGGNYTLGWEVNAERTTITVDALVKTIGYVGFGVSNRDGPAMNGSDIIIAGFDEDDGFTYFGDFHALQNGPPVLDAKQDGTLIQASQVNGETFVKFSRLLVTGDPNMGQDVDISTDTFLMWSYGSTDIVNYHDGNRGKVSQPGLFNIPPAIPIKLPKVAV